MALYKQISGNVVDENGDVLTDVNFKGYHVPTDTWSDVYNTSTLTQYNINLGDSLWLTQDGTVENNDEVLIFLETTEADPKDRRFGAFDLVLTSQDNYIRNVMLKPVQNPNVETLWSLSSVKEGTTSVVINIDSVDTDVLFARMNDVINVTENFNNNHHWTHDGTDMYHLENKFGQNLFNDRIGIDTKEYDWTENDNFVLDDEDYIYSYISPSTPGYNEVEVRVTNLKGMSVNDKLYVQIRYNVPTPDLEWSPASPSVNDTTTINGAIVDTDSRITSIKYYFDSNLVSANTNVDYSWVQDFGSLYQALHNTSVEIFWNDGFEDKALTYDENIPMTNLPPVFTLREEELGAAEENRSKYHIDTPSDPDGDYEKLNARWKIYYKTPLDNTFKLVYDAGYPAEIVIHEGNNNNLDPKEWVFTNSGEYKIEVTLRDEFNLETTQEVISTFISSSECTGEGTIRINNNAWQLIAIPVDGKNVEDYFINRMDAIIKTYDPSKSASDVIESASAYPGHVNKFLTYIPNFTLSHSEHNFSLVINDGSSINEVTGFWIKALDYHSITGGDDIMFNWSQGD
jgi:hypothetical protein